MRLHPQRRDGLSLIEVLASLAIFLMALTALTYLINTSSNLAIEARHRSRAAQIAHSTMNELAAGALPLEAENNAAVEDDPDYRRSIEVESGASQGLYNVTVRVRYRPDDPYPVEAALTRMMLDPKICGSTQDVPASPDASTEEGMTNSGSGSQSGSQPAAGGGSAAKGGNTAPKGGGTPATTTPKGGNTPAPANPKGGMSPGGKGR